MCRRASGLAVTSLGALLTAAACGAESTEALSLRRDPVSFGARWVGANRGLVAFCRSDEALGTCSRVYFAGDPSLGVAVTFEQAQRGERRSCANGAIPFSAPLGVAVEGEAEWDGPDGDARLAFTVLYDNGVEEVFRARLPIGSGPCP